MFTTATTVATNQQDESSMTYLKEVYEAFKKNLTPIEHDLLRLKELLDAPVYQKKFKNLGVLFGNLSFIARFKEGEKDLFEQDSDGNFIFSKSQSSDGHSHSSLILKDVVINNIKKMPDWLVEFFAKAKGSSKLFHKEECDKILERLELFLGWLENFSNVINRVALHAKIVDCHCSDKEENEHDDVDEAKETPLYQSLTSQIHSLTEANSEYEAKLKQESFAATELKEQLNKEKIALTQEVENLSSHNKLLESRLQAFEAQLIKLEKLLDETKQQEIQTKSSFEERVHIDAKKLADAEQRIAELNRINSNMVDQLASFTPDTPVENVQVKAEAEKDLPSPWYMFFSGVTATATVATAGMFLLKSQNR